MQEIKVLQGIIITENIAAKPFITELHHFIKQFKSLNRPYPNQMILFDQFITEKDSGPGWEMLPAVVLLFQWEYRGSLKGWGTHWQWWVCFPCS